MFGVLFYDRTSQENGPSLQKLPWSEKHRNEVLYIREDTDSAVWHEISWVEPESLASQSLSHLADLIIKPITLFSKQLEAWESIVHPTGGHLGKQSVNYALWFWG